MSALRVGHGVSSTSPPSRWRSVAGEGARGRSAIGSLTGGEGATRATLRSRRSEGLAVIGLAVASLAWALSNTSAQAQTLYRYLDEQGGVHFVDSPAKVPPSRRSGVSEVTSDPGHVPLTQPSESPPSPGSRDGGRAASEVHTEPAPESNGAGGACRLVFRNRRSRVEGTKTIYSGEVVNAGAGIARGVAVDFVDYDESDRVMDRRTVNPIPSTLGAREAGTFSIEMKTVERTAVKTHAKFARTAFEVRFVRCD